MQKTRHARAGRRTLDLEGQYLWEVTATTDDGQTATAVVAADTEREARTSLMLVQTTLRLSGQIVTYQVRQLDVANTLDLLQLLGKAWVTTLTCLTGDDQWQLRIESHPAPRWDENFSYTYRGTLASVVSRAYAGEPDDSDPAIAPTAPSSQPTKRLTEAEQNARALKDE